MEFCKLKTDFTAITVIDRAFLPNFFQVAVTFTVNNADTTQQNIAFQRMKHFLENELNFSIIAMRNSPLAKTLLKLQNKMVVLPDDGPDWALACALCFKLNAICEERFVINLVEVSSELGDNVTYYADWHRKDLLTAVLDLPAQDRWWLKSDLATNRHQKFNTWKDIGLDWNLTTPVESASIEKFIRFTPKVVKGGLEP